MYELSYQHSLQLVQCSRNRNVEIFPIQQQIMIEMRFSFFRTLAPTRFWASNICSPLTRMRSNQSNHAQNDAPWIRLTVSFLFILWVLCGANMVKKKKNLFKLITDRFLYLSKTPRQTFHWNLPWELEEEPTKGRHWISLSSWGGGGSWKAFWET